MKVLFYIVGKITNCNFILGDKLSVKVHWLS